MLMDEHSNHRLDFLETALLAAQRKHLESEDAGCRVGLQTLPDREGVLRQALAVLEAAPC
jgi:hypothetical protein